MGMLGAIIAWLDAASLRRAWSYLGLGAPLARRRLERALTPSGHHHQPRARARAACSPHLARHLALAAESDGRRLVVERPTADGIS